MIKEVLNPASAAVAGRTIRWWSVCTSASLAALLVLLASQSVRSQSSSGAKTKAPAAAKSPRERGEYLVTILGCNDCHTPLSMGPQGPEPDMSRMLSGHPETMKIPGPPALSEPWMWAGTGTNTAFAGPWGISYAANLTPDEETGMGVWTEETFLRSMRSGKHMGGSRQIMPPMPWVWYGKMTDDDLKAVFAYLKTVPRMKNRVPPYQPPPAPAKQ